MTSFDPAHIPVSFSSHNPRLSKEQAVYHTRHASTSKAPLHVSSIPDLRFEQSYLRTVAPYIRILDNEEEVGNEKGHIALGLDKEGTKQIVVTNWSRIAWVTARDQVLSPLFQGALWGVASQMLIPTMRELGSRLFWPLPPRQSSQQRLVPKADGQFVERLRTWSKSLAGGFETNIALAK